MGRFRPKEDLDCDRRGGFCSQQTGRGNYRSSTQPQATGKGKKGKTAECWLQSLCIGGCLGGAWAETSPPKKGLGTPLQGHGSHREASERNGEKDFWAGGGPRFVPIEASSAGAVRPHGAQRPAHFCCLTALRCPFATGWATLARPFQRARFLQASPSCAPARSHLAAGLLQAALA